MPVKVKVLFMVVHNSAQTFWSNFFNPNKGEGQNNIETIICARL